MQHVYIFSKFCAFMAEKNHPFFLILRIRSSPWKKYEKGYEHAWWRNQMETFFALLAHCAGNSPVNGEFPAQRPVARSFHVFFDLSLNKRSSKQSWGWWSETLSRSFWRHCNVDVRFRRREWLFPELRWQLRETNCRFINKFRSTYYQNS